MKYRETAFALTAAAALASCSGNQNVDGRPDHEAPAPLQFLEDAADSDYFQAVNCEADPSASASVTLTTPRDGASVILTLGETNYNPADLHNSALTFLGGVTIYAFNGTVYNIAASAGASMPQAEIDLSQKDYGDIIPITDDYSVVASMDQQMFGDTEIGVAAIQCQPNVVSTPPPPEVIV